MTLSPAMQSAINQLLQVYSEEPYSKDLVDDILTAVTATPTAYNSTVLIDWFHAYVGEFTVPGAVETRMSASSTLALNQGYIDWSFTWNDDPLRKIMVDVELWNMGVSSEAAEAIPYLRTCLTEWRTQTGREVGLYRLIPWAQIAIGTGLHDAVGASDVWAENVQRSKMVEYMRINDRNSAQLIDYVDFLVPRCYMMYTDWLSEWKYVTAWQILEAIRIARGKPVYPIIWFRHHPASGGVTDVPEATWTEMLQFVSGFPGIAGTWIWAEYYTTTLYDWKSDVNDLIAGQADFAPPPP